GRLGRMVGGTHRSCRLRSRGHRGVLDGVRGIPAHPPAGGRKIGPSAEDQGAQRFPVGEVSEPRSVGVGPWEGPPPAGEQWDPELLAGGDSRNVVDRYRYWSMEAIVADLDTRRHGFHVAVENWQHDLN